MTPSPPEEGSVGHAAGPPPESPQPYRRPTLDEVARRAGVSRSVASRAMNNTRDVSRAKRDAVKQAAAELGYTPHASARALATSRVGSVVLAVLDEEPEHFGEPFFSQVVVGITTVLTAAELDLTLVLASTRESRARLERLLRSHEADGVMMMAPRGEETLVAVADSSAMPVVFGGRPLREGGGHYVDVDNRGGARTAAEHLIATGRERIAALRGPSDLEAAVARHRGFTEALAVAGLRAEGVEAADFSFADAERAMTRLLSAHPDLDAVFAASDTMAAGALRALRAHGRSVPGDVAVVGFDDLAIARQVDPPLTTVRQPFHAFGQEIASMLLREMTGARPSPLILPTELVVRDSAPARG